MKELIAKRPSLIGWSLSTIVLAIALIAWGQGVGWSFRHLSTYQVFPLFGLVAFSSIWAVYAASFFARHLELNSRLFSRYYLVISLLILAAIILHPGLLIWQLWRDKLGLPPESYLHYVAPGLKWAVILSSCALLIFLAYEFRYKYRDRQWWKYLEYMADIAFAALFFHSLFLGTQLHHGWLRVVWFFYGLTLAVFLADIYYRKFVPAKKSRLSKKV